MFWNRMYGFGLWMYGGNLSSGGCCWNILLLARIGTGLKCKLLLRRRYIVELHGLSVQQRFARDEDLSKFFEILRPFSDLVHSVLSKDVVYRRITLFEDIPDLFETKVETRQPTSKLPSTPPHTSPGSLHQNK